MENLAFTVLVGVVSSVFGAMAVAFGQSGWRSVLSLKKASREALVSEREKYQGADKIEKSLIANEYLFSAIRCLLVANLLWVLPEVVDAVLNATAHYGLEFSQTQEVWSGFWVFRLIATTCSLFVFYIGFGRIVRFTKISAL